MNPEIDNYIAAFPPPVREKLEQIRAVIRAAAPEAKEVVSYGMPAYKLHTVLVYFAGYKAHIGFYPTASGIAAFQQEFSGYKSSKGAVQFPVDQPLPVELITRIVQFRINDDALRAEAKKKKKS
ncbi:MAG TPA: DUF1801 domain-containing protein [Flavilitoribacter sp.]|nr:DUF1801 domain-containing protein [Flavilitoribacter sp.]HMQ90570.1 DUF1801 domain-containing protein [Flavilitoribacter sp.]